MRIRPLALIVVLAAVLSGALGQPFSARAGAAVAAAAWAPTPPLNAARDSHTATTLPDGQVLVVGGGNTSGVLASAERYDPATNRWTLAGSMGTPRGSHTATLLPNGQVLVAGGGNADGITPTAERYDPASGSWSSTGSLGSPRAVHTATLLANGQVLVVGGVAGVTNDSRPLATAERYDPATGRWSPAGSLSTGRLGHTATLLPGGQVLVVGGSTWTGAAGSAELYDPATDRWRPAAAPGAQREFHTATPLPDGQVLVAGGVNATGQLASAERYDPATDRWMPAGTMRDSRQHHTATPLPGGQVLVAGGANADEVLATSELYDPVTGGWSPAAPLNIRRVNHRAAPLPDGRVLVVAGGIASDGSQTAELYTDGTPPQQCFAETGYCVRGRFLAYWQTRGLDLGDPGVSSRESLALFGYPLSDEFEQTLEDGKTYRVQYFERARMEHHPENPPPYDVLLGQFGRRILAGVPNAPTAPVPPDPQAGTPDARYSRHFPETGHNVGGRFLAYWELNGGLAVFGYPLSEEFEERLEDGTVYLVQYFERARFEYHPENPVPYDVLLGQFGRRILAETRP